jgi:hypothetical protein
MKHLIHTKGHRIGHHAATNGNSVIFPGQFGASTVTAMHEAKKA